MAARPWKFESSPGHQNDAPWHYDDNGYFFLRRDCLGDLSLTSAGYKVLFEILVKGSVRNHFSIPFVFRNRQYSNSKLNVREYLLFAKQLLYFAVYKLTSKIKG